MMGLFTKLMGLFWLFAEGLIMVYVRKGLLFLETGQSRQRVFTLFCLILFAAIVALYAVKGLLLNLLQPSSGSLAAALYNRYLWNFICTLWVLIEGAIAIYGFRIYRLLKAPPTGYPAPGKTVYNPGLWILCILFLAGFTFYHGYLYLLISRAALSGQAIINIFRFYIKACGFFWILIEWAVALIAMKIYLFLKGGRHDSVAA